MSVTIPRFAAPALDAVDWPGALSLDIAHFHDRGSDHRPRTRVSLSHDGEALHIKFDIDDRYVRAVATANQGEICRDSCVEAFLEPVCGKGYFNFEFNCGGTMLLYHITGDLRKGEGVAHVHEDWLARVERFTTMPRIVEPEIAEPVTWRLAARIPFALFEHHTGSTCDNTWRGNFYKCADFTSHPHWGSWLPIGDKCDFHQPDKFGELRLA